MLSWLLDGLESGFYRTKRSEQANKLRRVKEAILCEFIVQIYEQKPNQKNKKKRKKNTNMYAQS